MDPGVIEMRIPLWIAMIVTVNLIACNYTEGECYPRGQGGGNAGVGGSIIVPDGAGGFGDVPPEPQGATDTPPDCNIVPESACDATGGAGGGTAADGETYAYCSDACMAKCSAGGVNGFSPTLFKFATTVPDDGTGEAGGWQVASASLKFVRWTSVLPEPWACPVTIGMPLRTSVNGTVSPGYAATIAAGVATQASSSLMKISPDLPSGVFCSKLKPAMQSLLNVQYPTIGAKMM